jgi:hypothetical protein
MSPLVIFDARHGWMNYKSMFVFFTQRQTTVSARPWTSIPKLLPLFKQYITRIVAGKSEIFGKYLSYTIIAGVAYLLLNIKKFTKREKSALLIIFVWFAFAFVGLGVYKQHIYDHYFGFIYPAIYLLLAALFVLIEKNFKFKGKLTVFLLIAVITFFNFSDNPLKYNPNNQYRRAERISKKIIEVSNGEPFNFAVIAKTNYETGYSYFFDLWDSPKIDIIADRASETITEQLLVICELEEREKCNPETNERPELAHFGWRKIVASWEYDGVIIYKLIHAEE